MSTKTRWERFCDWLSGPETPEPIRPFVAKLAECIRLGDCTQEPRSSAFASCVVIKFALADDLSASVEITTWQRHPLEYYLVNPMPPRRPRLANITLGGSKTTDFNTSEEAAILGAYQVALEEERQKAKIKAEASKAEAIAKIEAYTPKVPSPAASQTNQP